MQSSNHQDIVATTKTLFCSKTCIILHFLSTNIWETYFHILHIFPYFIFARVVAMPTMSCEEDLHCVSAKMRVQSMPEVASMAYISVVFKASHKAGHKASD